MQYRKFGRLDWQASVLGFGCMRFPTFDNDSAKINEPEAARLLYHAIDSGLNYLDTAYNYHGEQSESFFGRALQRGWREKVRLATKLPHWKCENSAECEAKCPQHLPICDLLADADAVLGMGKPYPQRK
jgi:predicted aldo/keto reductase-like oxidoreductase